MRNLLLVAALFSISSALCQTKTYVGIKGGGHITSAFIDHTIFNFNARTTFQPGISTGLMIKHFPKKRDVFFNSGIQGGVNFVQKGWVQTFENTPVPNYEIRMNYLEVPIEGFGYFGNKTKYFISAGFLVEFLLGTQKDADPVDLTLYDFVTYVEARDREIGYGGRFSGGIFRDFPFGSLHLEGFFSYSFSNFIDAGDLTNDQLPDISNHWNMGVSVGYFIPFGKLALTK